MTQSLMRTYAPLPVSFTHGEGVYLWDSQGNRYLDALSGIAVNGLGHAHPRLTETIAKQAGKLMHVSNLYQIAEQQRLADQLTQITGLESCFFCNSGTEANEAAIKLARLYGHRKDIALPKIIVAEQSFHGRTLAALSATGNAKIQQGFEPLVEGFVRVPYDDIAALKAAADAHEGIVAVLLEPVQGEGGLHIPESGYLKAVRDLCDAQDWLMMLDEVQTGNGRTGTWFGFQHDDICPDVMTTAKGLGNGFPIGACLAGGKAATVFGPGDHGSTFGGNPLACAAASCVLDVIEDEGLLANANERSAQLQAAFTQSLAGIDGVKDIRSKGLMIGIELDRPCPELVTQALHQEQLLLNVTAAQVVRLLPPLIIDSAECDELVEKVSRLIRTFLAA